MSHFLSPLVCRPTHLAIDPAQPFHYIIISNQLIFTSSIHALFVLCLGPVLVSVQESKFSSTCPTSMSTLNHLHSILITIITSTRTICIHQLEHPSASGVIAGRLQFILMIFLFQRSFTNVI